MWIWYWFDRISPGSFAVCDTLHNAKSRGRCLLYGTGAFLLAPSIPGIVILINQFVAK